MRKINFYNLIVLMLFFTESYSQKIIIDGKEGDRLLRWDDFQGFPNSEFAAFTYWDIVYSYSFASKKNDTVLCDFKVEVKFNHEKSWIKREKETEKLLKHEQGHFDIGKLCGGELQSEFKTTVLLVNNYQDRIKGIFKTVFNKYKEMQTKYDAETKHGLDEEQQKNWDNFFYTELKKYSM